MGVISESSLVEVAQMGHHGVDAAQETLILFDNIKLIGTTTKTSDSFTKVLGQNLESPVCFLAADENLAYYNTNISLIREERGRE